MTTLDLSRLPRVLDRLEQLVAAFEKDIPLIAATSAQRFIANQHRAQKNVFGQPFKPITAKWLETKRGLGLFTQRGAATGTMGRQIRSPRAVSRAGPGKAVVDVSKPDLRARYPKVLGGSRRVNSYLGFFDKLKASGKMIAVSPAMEKVIAEVADKFFDATVLERL